MQESHDWTPPGGTLGTILDATRKRLPTLDRVSDLAAPQADRARQVAAVGGRPPRLGDALRGTHVAVVAEIKRKSPSKGVLNAGLSAVEQARAFERGGAAAISVLTEPEFFGGSIDDLTEVRTHVHVPLLKKDFHIHGLQLLEARAARASAVLLIARALAPRELPMLMDLARQSELECVVEVRDELELSRALDAGAEIVGVNSRNLETLDVDPRVPERIVPMIPRDVIAIWESGVRSRADVERAAAFGADAVLVGSALSQAADPESLVGELARVRRVGRG